jgi:hypothetical protein
METQTIVITIGRDVANEPMPDGDWEAFIASVSWLFFLDHHILVHTKARGTGYWEGDMEDNFTMVVTVPTGYTRAGSHLLRADSARRGSALPTLTPP